MSIFEVVFNLVGLVLGLALVEVLSGLTRLLAMRGQLRVGWLVPLTGIWMLGDVTSFWGQAYELRELMPSVWPSLGVGLVITSLYYVAASLVVPRDLSDQAAYDAAWWRNKRVVFGLVLLCEVSTWAIGLILGRVWTPVIAAINFSWAVVVIALLLLPGRRANVTLLVLLIANQIWGFATP